MWSCGKTIKVSLEKVQRSGVRTEMVQKRVIDVLVRAVGTVMHDESRITVVAVRSEGYIEELFVSKTGEHVHAGQPLFRIYSPDIQKAQIDLLYGLGQDGTAQRLRNLGVPYISILRRPSGLGTSMRMYARTVTVARVPILTAGRSVSATSATIQR
jgi:multidrug efflux pump subunit AcrA (membrane-fusion protein)